jgi:molybdenum cofactor cytidylyltransferase
MAACEYSGTVGVPALFTRALFPELRELKEGAKPLLRRYASQLAAVPFPGGAVDIDTPEDAARHLT